MKALMTIAAVAFSSVLFANSVESDNVVGYQTIEGKTGFTQLTPSFAGIGEEYSIQNIVISGDNVLGMGGETLQFVDSEGNSPEYYTWYGAAFMGVAGWYDSSFMLATRTVSPSESFLISNNTGVYAITIAGQVNYTAIPALNCEAGFTSVGNMTPVAKGIQKYAISGDNGLGMGGETLQFVDAEGNSPEYYTWYGAAFMGVAGWYDSSFILSARDIQPTEGFLLSNNAGTYVVSVPATND